MPAAWMGWWEDGSMGASSSTNSVIAAVPLVEEEGKLFTGHTLVESHGQGHHGGLLAGSTLGAAGGTLETVKINVFWR